MIGATLFSGIGAPETAMPSWHWPWHAEIEKFPSAVMAQRHSQSVNLGDVTAHDCSERAAAIGRPDVIVFGSPCQSFSVAGKRLGMDDPRGNLALVALGIVGRLAPRWFVFENVPGLLSSAEGRDFGLFLRTVDELRYSLAWASLDAQYFGVAQRRERLFAVGYSGDWRGPAAVLLEPESLCGNSPPRREARASVAPTLAARTKGGGGLGTDFDCDGGLISAPLVPILAATLESGGHSRNPLHETLLPVAFDTTQITSGENRCRPEPGDPCHPLPAHGHAPAIARPINMQVATRHRALGRGTGFGIGEDGDAAYTLGRNHTHAVETSSSVRRLTPEECEALQGYWRGYTAITYRGKPAADGPRYKALGNSMAVPVMRWILSRIEQFEART